MTFIKGQSGNPAGRPPGSKNRKNLLEQELLEGEAAAIMRRLIDNAVQNDKLSLRLCAERLVPRAKAEARAVPFELPPINSVADLPAALSAIVKGVASGELSAAEAASLSQVVDRLTNAVQTVELDSRLEKIKEMRGGNQTEPQR